MTVNYKYYTLNWREVLHGYEAGIFPMGEDELSICWFESEPRSIIPVELPTSRLHITRSLNQTLKKNIFEVKTDTSFGRVIRNCSEREHTWINRLIISAYEELFRRGYAHSIEAWLNGKLVGGLYGVALKGAFFGESMFHTESNASKICVVKLYEILKKNSYILFDIQMMTPLFRTFGAVEISKRGYHDILRRAMTEEREFNCNL